MKLLSRFLIIFFTLSYVLLSAATNRETRAVWITTNFSLDWPPKTFNENDQKESLKKIFENLSEKKFNTVYFQVRSNGTVLYYSDIEPFSPYLTGQTGLKPSYDPLQYAIDLGREFNIEVHAWINTIRCFSGSDDIYLQHPKHIRNANPDWTVRVMSENGSLSYWMNPGYFRVQDYLVDLMNELVSKYDIDGIHLDFFRYPDKDFDDDKYFKQNGFNTTLDEWRRNNLTTILRKFKASANPKNPLLKVGATPIGIRKSLKDAIGWEGYSSVYQDTERWLEEQLVDYLTPQIYWNFKDNPKFDILADDWVEKSYNRNIILGLAAYKNDVKLELQEMIEYSRKIGAAGVSFFRYENISSPEDNYFNDLAFPSNMFWKEKVGFSPGYFNASYDRLNEDEVLIKWNDITNLESAENRGYVLLNDDSPIKLISSDKNKLRLKFSNPKKLMYGYQIRRLDRLWNYSSFSDNLNIYVPYLFIIKKSSKISKEPILYKPNDSSAYLGIFSSADQDVLIDFINIENIGSQEKIFLKSGFNIVSISRTLKMINKIRITYLLDESIEEISIL